MKTIKFRAWDKKGKKMFLVSDLSYRHLYGEKLDLPRITVFMKSGDRVGPVEIFDPDNKRLELMQFTGLKDKKGKEIYEGDLVKSWNNIYEVRWKLNRFTFILVKKLKVKMKDNLTDNKEIIGNIYENPELING